MKYTKEERLDIVIRSGKVIGDNVNIGTNAVVTHDIPSNCVVGEH